MMDNYERMKRDMERVFAGRDHDAIADMWRLDSDARALYATLLGRRYRIARADGAVTFTDGHGTERHAGYNEAMTLFDILTRSRADADGRPVSLNSLSTLHTSAQPSDGIFGAWARKFAGRTGELSTACERLGGARYGRADAGYMLNVFRDLNIVIEFMDADDEFPAALHFLCDANILRFMHYETVMFMLSHVLDRLYEIMDKE